MPSTLHQLLNLLTKAVADLDAVTAETSTQIPDLNEPFHPASEAFRLNPIAAEAAMVASSAALQIAATLMPPQASLMQAAVAATAKAAALRVCLESNVTEILREAGPKGLHVEHIASKNGQNPGKLARFLRILATNYIYREIEPDVFANNRISSLLDTLKPSEEVIADPEHKHDNTNGVAALVGHHMDEVSKGFAFVWENVSDPRTMHSGEPNESAWARAMDTRDAWWEYYSKPEEKFRNQRFNIGMHGVQAVANVDVALKRFNWKDLQPGSVVVDVGGGVGSTMRIIAKEFPHLNLVVQDIPIVIEQAKEVWASSMPDVISSGRVTLQAHDFFTPQTQKNAAVFFLKHVIHDWSDQYAKKILVNLREAASPQTKLYLLDSLLPFACHTSKMTTEIPGAIPDEAPEPLLPNYGPVNDLGYVADMVMLSTQNAQERTFVQMNQLLRSTGWRMISVHKRSGDNLFLQPIEAVPI